MSEVSSRHEKHAAGGDPVRCAVLTVSDTRTESTDRSGPLLVELLERSGHRVTERDIVPDEPAAIRERLERWLADPQVDAIVTNGGTGIGRRDTTIDVVQSLLSVELDGFGELFRMLSYRRVGGAAIMSRATGGLVYRDAGAGGDTVVFATPGSPDAVETAVEHLVAPQLAHLVWERRR